MSGLDKMLDMVSKQAAACALFHVHWIEKIEENSILATMYDQFEDYLRDQGAKDWWEYLKEGP